MIDREDQAPDPAASSRPPAPAQLHILHLKSVAQTVRHGYNPADVQAETHAGLSRRKLLAFKSLNAPGPFKSR
jgi:hypothetical protein